MSVLLAAASVKAPSVEWNTLIPYLVLDKTYAEKPDFEGAKYVMSPPIRPASARVTRSRETPTLRLPVISLPQTKRPRPSS